MLIAQCEHVKFDGSRGRISMNSHYSIQFLPGQGPGETKHHMIGPGKDGSEKKQGQSAYVVPT